MCVGVRDGDIFHGQGESLGANNISVEVGGIYCIDILTVEQFASNLDAVR